MNTDFIIIQSEDTFLGDTLHISWFPHPNDTMVYLFFKMHWFSSLHSHFLSDLYGLMSVLEECAASRKAISCLMSISRNECLITDRRNTSTLIGSQWAFLPLAPMFQNSRHHEETTAFCGYRKAISQLIHSRRSHRRLGCSLLETSVPVHSSIVASIGEEHPLDFRQVPGPPWASVSRGNSYSRAVFEDQVR